MKLISSLLSLFLLVCCWEVKAQPEAGPDVLMLNHIAVYVHNLEESTAFYDEVLGLKKIPEPFHDGLHTWYSIGPAGQLHLIQGADKDIKRNKNDHLCFSTTSMDDFIANLDGHKIYITTYIMQYKIY